MFELNLLLLPDLLYIKCLCLCLDTAIKALLQLCSTVSERGLFISLEAETCVIIMWYHAPGIGN